MEIQLPAQINAQKTTLVKENDIVKILYRHPSHKNRYPKKGEMSKDNGTNVIKALDNRSIGNPNSQQQINWDGLIRQHIETYALHLEFRINMFRRL